MRSSAATSGTKLFSRRPDSARIYNPFVVRVQIEVGVLPHFLEECITCLLLLLLPNSGQIGH
eukprot:2148921-Amphidinium_carterae.1